MQTLALHMQAHPSQGPTSRAERSDSLLVESPSNEKEEDRLLGSVLPDRLTLGLAAVGSLHSNSRLTCRLGR